jgi:HAD superfamily hydrolase (TIGR01662 family)
LIRAVLVDLGDTLVHLDRPSGDVFRDDLESLYAFLKSAGLNSEFQEFSKVFIREYERASALSQFYKVEVPMHDIISRVLRKIKLKDPEGTLAHSAMIQFFRPELQSWQVYPDTVKILSGLRTHGFKVGLVSNTKSDWAVRAILEKLSLTKFFDTVVTSAALHVRKPRFDIFSQALEALDVKSTETVFVGDSLQADILGAKTAGIRAIHVSRRPLEHQPYVAPNATVSSLSEALVQIVSWNSASVKEIAYTDSPTT